MVTIGVISPFHSLAGPPRFRVKTCNGLFSTVTAALPQSGHAGSARERSSCFVTALAAYVFRINESVRCWTEANRESQ